MIIFVTGTDTDVGKTAASSILAYGWSMAGHRTAYLKVIQTGPVGEDSAAVAAVAPHVTVLDPLVHYPQPSAPTHAWAHMNRTLDSSSAAEEVDLQNLVQKIGCIAHDYEILICEGAGGICVPLNMRGETFQQLVQQLGCAYVLVCRSSLGTLNHTILSLQATRCWAGAGFVLMNGEAHRDNQASLKRISIDYGVEFLGHLSPIDWTQHPQTILHEQAVRLSSQISTHLDSISHTSFSQSDSQNRRDECATRGAVLWHPYTQHGLNEDPITVERAHGQQWFLKDQSTLVDGISSWWTNILGHGLPELGAAIHTQHQSLDHVLFGGVSHAPARELADLIVHRCNEALLDRNVFDRVFFSDNGSTAVEVALKMAYIYSTRKRGLKQGHFVSAANGYHGDTLGAMSVSHTDQFHGSFSNYKIRTHALQPHYRYGDHLESSWPELEEYFATHTSQIYGVIIEPMIQGAAGMKFICKDWLACLVKLCGEYSVPIIFDEVFVGFYRLGTYLAIHQIPDAKALFDTQAPQIICLSKGLTAGTGPLAVTVTKPELFEVFCSQDPADALQHGHTFTAHPMACAAAIKTHQIIDRLMSDDKKAYIDEFESIYGQLISASQQYGFTDRGIWSHPRTYGTVFAFELGGEACPQSCVDLVSILRQKGLYVRPLGRTFYLCPAYNMSVSMLKDICDMILWGLESWYKIYSKHISKSV